MKGQYKGQLIGYQNYQKDGKTVHIYEIFIPGNKDQSTGFYTTECSIVRIFSDVLISPLKANMSVDFSGELKNGVNGQYMKYSDICPSK